MANLGFLDSFAGANAIFQPFRVSDHSPAILHIPTMCKIKPRPFKFSNILVQNSRFKQQVQECWGTSPNASPKVPNNVSNSSITDGKYVNDDINLADLRSYIDKRMEEEKVLEIPKDDVHKDVNDGSAMEDTPHVSSINDISLHEPPGSVLMDKGTEAGSGLREGR
ncbi:reverse transcriptase domain, Reverse transcriptase zinc-binding domain protein [Artemisia annua]|uniref:Reverse transcriptase domain, Reverse transcriptase zinc-binding domain protein n=1 Tax=Artemisia annua TaxID=35608 RepID=A0A2U1LZ37_ARTAN|nr:reverse transcriptase domain, Reverse transcriptase zinc-binding domain protein [Artemisia annua]